MARAAEHVKNDRNSRNSLNVLPRDIIAAFRENDKLAEMLENEELAEVYEPVPLVPYTAELLMEIVERSECVDVLICSDRARISERGQWSELMSRDAAFETVLGRASDRISGMAANDAERKELGLTIESAATKIPSCFRCSSAKIVALLDKRMIAYFKSKAGEQRALKMKFAEKTPMNRTTVSKITVSKTITKITAERKSSSPTKKSVMPRIRTAVEKYVEGISDTEFTAPKNPSEYVSKIFAQILKNAGCNETPLNMDTVERYLWEIGEPLDDGNRKRRVMFCVDTWNANS